MTIDGSPVRFSGDYGAPFLDSAGRTQVPFRRTLEVFGCTVSWDNPSRTAWAEKDGVQVAVPIGQPWMTVNGHRVDLDTAAQIWDNRTYLPIRPVLEAFGAYVTWDGEARQVVVTTGAAWSGSTSWTWARGDAALIDCGTTEVLIDGGDNGAGAAVAAYLAAYVDGPLDYLIATHPDADHIVGLDEVLAAYPVGEVIDSGRTSDTKTYADYWAAVQAEGCTLSYDEDRILPPVGQHRSLPPGNRGCLGGQQRLLRGGPAHLRQRPGPLHRGHDRPGGGGNPPPLRGHRRAEGGPPWLGLLHLPGLSGRGAAGVRGDLLWPGQPVRPPHRPSAPAAAGPGHLGLWHRQERPHRPHHRRDHLQL